MPPSPLPKRPARGVYVSRRGDDAGDGTRERPVTTLSRAVDIASARHERALFVSGGVFAGGLRVTVSIYGGLDPRTWRRSRHETTRIHGVSEASVLSVGRDCHGVVYADLEIVNETGDGISSPLSSYALVCCVVRATRCAVFGSEGLTIVDSRIEGGTLGVQSGHRAPATVLRSTVIAGNRCRAGIELNGGGVVQDCVIRIGAGSSSRAVFACGPARILDNRIELSPESENTQGVWAADEAVVCEGNVLNGMPLAARGDLPVGWERSWSGAAGGETCHVRVEPGGLVWWGESDNPVFCGRHSSVYQTFADFKTAGPRCDAPPDSIVRELRDALGA